MNISCEVVEMFEKGHPVYGGFETRFKKGQVPWNKNKSYEWGHHTEETKKKIKLALIGKKHKYKYILKKCKNCKKNFKGILTQVYCSKKCRTYCISSNLNKKRYETNYWKEKICLICKKPFRRQGRLYCSQKCQGIANRGKNNINWKNGVTLIYRGIRFSREYDQWRMTVFKRDNFTCQNCHQIGGELHAHHLKPFATNPKLRFEISNGITLCEDCHKEIDGNWGRPANVQN